jgi:hypothetical protein
MGAVLSESFEMHVVELPKFRRNLMKNSQEGPRSHLDNWLQFLLDPSDKIMERIIMTDPRNELQSLPRNPLYIKS